MDNVLGKVKQLKPVNYHYLTNKNNDAKYYGFIAQDVKDIFPSFVSEDENGNLGVAYSYFGVIAIKAIQEQQDQIDKQQQQIDQQQQQINLLIKEIQNLKNSKQ